MKIKKAVIICLIMGLLLTSCSSLETPDSYSFSNENITVSFDVEKQELKEFEVFIKNTSDTDILLLITEAKVLTKDGKYAAIISTKDALSQDNTVEIRDVKLKANQTFEEKYVAVGYLRKQILDNEFILLPWIDINQFEFSLPYIINGKEKVLKISF